MFGRVWLYLGLSGQVDINKTTANPLAQIVHRSRVQEFARHGRSPNGSGRSEGDLYLKAAHGVSLTHEAHEHGFLFIRAPLPGAAPACSDRLKGRLSRS